MHFALLAGYGASAINPYLAIETFEDLARRGYLPSGVTAEVLLRTSSRPSTRGCSKHFLRWGISTLPELSGRAGFF